MCGEGIGESDGICTRDPAKERMTLKGRKNSLVKERTVTAKGRTRSKTKVGTDSTSKLSVMSGKASASIYGTEQSVPNGRPN
jgi:hypothetical protein